jgi:hypothetical protein
LRFKTLFFICGILITNTCLYAQSFRASIEDNGIYVGKQFELSFIAENGKVQDLKLPNIPNVKIVGGPNMSQSTTIINGVVSSKSATSYVLIALQVGNITIPPARAIVNGKITQSNAITIDVKKEATAPTVSTIKGGSKKDIYLTATLSKQKVLIGEQVVLEYNLYTSLDVSDASVLSESKYNGFFTKEITPSNPLNEQVRIKGKTFIKRIINRIALFPLQKGVFQLEPLVLKLIVQKPESADPFAFGFDFDDVSVTSESLVIQVQDLPPNKDLNFSGIVANNFNFDYQLDKLNISTDDAITLNLQIDADCDPQKLIPPILTSNTFYNIFDPKILKDSSYSQGGRYRTKKIIEYVIYPKKAGDFSLNVPFTYLDANSGKYFTKNIGPKSIHIEQGKVITSKNGEQINTNNKNILGLKSIFSLQKKKSPVLLSSVFWFWSLLPIIIFIGFFFYQNYFERLKNMDIVILKKRRAISKANKKLNSSRIYLQIKDERSFYNEIIKTLMGYISDKLHIEQSSLSKEHIAAKMKDANLTQATVNSFMDQLSNAESALFAGQKGEDSMQSVYNNTKIVIDTIERELKLG